jgi:hypothetical protein
VGPLLGMASPISPAFSRLTETDFRRVSLELTSAQILALETTPVTIIPAPGVGFMIVPFMAIVHFFGGSVAYTNAGGIVKLAVGATMLQALTEQFITTVSPNRTVTATGTFGSGAVTTSPGQGATSAANPPDADNQPLTIQKITNNYAAGNGTARVTIYYTVEPTA